MRKLNYEYYYYCMQRNDISTENATSCANGSHCFSRTSDSVGYIQDCSQLWIMIKITSRLSSYKFIHF